MHETHLFLYTIHYFSSSFPYNPSDRQLPQSFAVTYDSASSLSYGMKSTRRFLVFARGARLRASLYCRAQHSDSASPGQALQGMHTLPSQRPKARLHMATVSKSLPPREGNPKPETKHLLWEPGKTMAESVIPCCLMLLGFPSELTDGNAYRTCTTGQTRAATRTSQFWSFSSFSCSCWGLHSPVCFFSSWGERSN